METIEFSRDVAEQLKCYVYRLVDPRNGRTFYVGKGTGNRVFDHVKCGLSSDENGIVPLKLKTIREIHKSGLEVIQIIQRWGLTEKEAFEIESTLIDLFSLDLLTNEINGFDVGRCATNAEVLQKELSRKEFVDDGSVNYIIIKLHSQWLEKNDDDIYKAAKGYWKISPEKAKNYPIILVVVNDIVREVFEVKNWDSFGDTGRYEFDGVVANDSIRSKFFDKKTPAKYRKKGQSNPIMYSKLGE